MLTNGLANNGSMVESPPGLFRGLSAIRARLLAGTGANLLGQGVTAGIQLVSLPMMLHIWDTARYGKWVVLSAVPTYFAMSDGGLLPVAANKINMLQAGGHTKEANAVFQSALALVLAAIAVIGTTAALAIFILGNQFLDRDSCLALSLMVFATLISLFGGLFDAAFRAFEKYAQGVLFANAIRLIEFLGFALGLFLWGTFTGVALGSLAGRCFGTLVLWNICRSRFSSLRWGFADANRQQLRALLKPAITYLAFPLGNSLSIQAITLIVGALLGSTIVAIFNTYRTLSRIALQLTAAFSHAVWTEFSRLYGAAEPGMLRRLYDRAMLTGGVINITMSIALVAAAPSLLQWWSHGKIAFHLQLFLLFALATFVGGLSHVPRVLLMATNRHSRLGVLYLYVSAVGALLALVGSEVLGPDGAALAMIAIEVGILFFAVTLAHRMIEEMPGSSVHAER
jgi:O-antigen/teichoic acid export membrane protein